MSNLPNCPSCASEFTYLDGYLLTCPECSHEWLPEARSASNEEPPGEITANDSEEDTVRDSNGTLLSDGDSVSVIKDLKVKGTSSVVKVGTRVKNIRLVEGDHDIDCKIEGIGAMKLKSQFVKKV